MLPERISGRTAAELWSSRASATIRSVRWLLSVVPHIKGVPAMTTPARAALTTEHKASIVLLLLLPAAAIAQEEGPEFTDDFPVEECAFTPFGGNELFSLMP